MDRFLLGESQSRTYPNMCAKFGGGPTFVSKKGGIDRQRDRQRDTAALYIDGVVSSRLQFRMG